MSLPHFTEEELKELERIRKEREEKLYGTSS